MTDQPHAEAIGPSQTPRDRPLPLRQMAIGELIDAAIRLYRLEWKVMMAVVAFVVVPVSFVEIWATQLVIGQIGPTTVSTAFGGLLTITLVSFAVQFLVVQPFLTAAVTRAASDVYLGEPVTIGGTYRYALRRLPAILWVTILSTLLILVGLVLLIIPGIIALVRLSVAPAALVVEGASGSTALRRSWRLTKGAFWRTLGILVLSGIVAGIVSSILSIPGEFVVQALGPDAWPISSLAAVLATVLVTPFGTLVIVLLYFDLRIRKEGFDIEVMARELATAP